MAERGLWRPGAKARSGGARSAPRRVPPALATGDSAPVVRGRSRPSSPRGSAGTRTPRPGSREGGVSRATAPRQDGGGERKGSHSPRRTEIPAPAAAPLAKWRPARRPLGDVATRAWTFWPGRRRPGAGGAREGQALLARLWRTAVRPLGHPARPVPVALAATILLSERDVGGRPGGRRRPFAPATSAQPRGRGPQIRLAGRGGSAPRSGRLATHVRGRGRASCAPQRARGRHLWKKIRQNPPTLPGVCLRSLLSLKTFLSRQPVVSNMFN